MPISRIEAYEIPHSSAILPSRAPFSIQPQRATLLIHDLQDYFLEPFDHLASPIVPALANIERLRALCDSLEMPVVFSAQPGEQDRQERGLLWEMWGPGIVRRPELAGFASKISPTAQDHIIEKRRYSAFFETELQSKLAELGRDQLIVTGIYAHIGCQATCLDGFMRGIETFLVSDAVADFSLDDHLIALRQVARTCGVVTSTDDLVSSLQRCSQVALSSQASLPILNGVKHAS